MSGDYDHKSAEKKWQEYWEREGTYRWKPGGVKQNNFTIDTPPPTVSGLLHMGHIFSYTQADFIARYQRMQGKDVFYPMGFDDNGLPTERLVEKVKGKKAAQYPSREDFIADCKDVVKEAEDEFRKLFKSTALSVDWTQEYQTISEESRKLSQMSFLDLYEKGHIYRDFRPTYWDWVDQTAIAQAEIENKELPGVMNEIEFTLEDSSPLVIATTRPELLGACVAVMYHPEDPNAAKYKDKFAITPLFGVKVPMIADELVEKDKGTGIVMCCTFGDDTDKEWWRKHGLPMRCILDLDGRVRIGGHSHTNNIKDGLWFLAGKDGRKDSSGLNARNTVDINSTISAFEKIVTLKPKQANAKVIELLQAENKLLKQTPITHTVKCAERSGTPIEIIPTHQWFVRIMDKKDALKKKSAECNWHPEWMKLRLDQWIDGLKEDWCISRQRYFGVPIPAWYIFNNDPNNKTLNKADEYLIAPSEVLPVDPLQEFPNFRFSSEDYEIAKEAGIWFATNKENPSEVFTVTPDKDVLDTWATSSISPQLSSKAINQKYAVDFARHKQLFPADLRPQAHEIIRTWAFYTIVKAYLHENTIPWRNLMISGWCLAADKTKMSKSKGNVVTPVALIEEKGADAVRYWASTSRLGADTAFSEDLLKIGKKLVNKLWNAAKFAGQHLENIKKKPGTAAEDASKGIISEPLDLWILTRLHRTTAKAMEEFERFEYCDARVAIEDFFWNDFCDNYLEMVKARAYGESGGNSASAIHTIYHCLDGILRLFAPFVPHITEELYSSIFKSRGSIHSKNKWPLAHDYPVSELEEMVGITAVAILNEVRKFKADHKLSMKVPIETLSIQTPKEKTTELEYLKKIEFDLKSVTNSTTLTWHDGPFAVQATLGRNTGAA